MTAVSIPATTADLTIPDDPTVTDQPDATGSDVARLSTVLTGDIVEAPLDTERPNDWLTWERENLDPRELLDKPSRAEIGDLSDLLASIPVVGIVYPLIVVRLPDLPPIVETDPATGEAVVTASAPRHEIIIGHRKKYAAIELGMPVVPCWIAPDHGAALRILMQLAENGHRVALTATDEAEAFHQLTLMNWSPEQIAQVRAVPTAKVEQALRLRELPAAAKNAADAGTLTLEDAAALGEFAEAPSVVTRLLKATGTPWGFRHALTTERDKRDFAKAKELAKANLVIAGVTVTSKPKQWESGGPEVDVTQLLDANGEPVDVEKVRTLPGFAAFIEKAGGQAKTVVYCTDPAKYGYQQLEKRYGRTLSPDEAAAEAEAKRVETERLEQLRLAAGVRHEFIRTTYGSARAAKRLFPEALRDAVSAVHSVHFADVDDLYKALGGGTPDEVAAAKEDKLRRCLVAKWICAHECNLGITTEQYQWSLSKPAAVFWYDLLVADGYTLAPAEADLYAAWTTADSEDDDVEGDEFGVEEVEGSDEPHHAADDEQHAAEAGGPDGGDDVTNDAVTQALAAPQTIDLGSDDGDLDGHESQDTASSAHDTTTHPVGAGEPHDSDAPADDDGMQQPGAGDTSDPATDEHTADGVWDAELVDLRDEQTVTTN